MDNVEDLQKQIAKLDRIMAKSLQRRGEIEQILFDVATGKLPPPSPQDCRVLALKLGTDKADWPEQIANHVWQGNTERDALSENLKFAELTLRNTEKALEINRVHRDELKKKNDALAAQVEQLSILCLAYEDKLPFPVITKEVFEPVFKARELFAHVRAEAVIEAVKFFHPSLDIDAEALESYAERIRQEKK